MSNICTKSEQPVYPFATQSSALLICSAKGQRGESKRESRESKRRERERQGEWSGKGTTQLIIDEKAQRAGFTDCQHCWQLPPPLPLRHCQLALFALEFPWLAALPDNAQSALKIRVARQKKLFSQRKKQQGRERGRERVRKIYQKKQAKRNHFKCGLKLSLISAAKCFCWVIYRQPARALPLPLSLALAVSVVARDGH